MSSIPQNHFNEVYFCIDQLCFGNEIKILITLFIIKETIIVNTIPIKFDKYTFFINASNKLINL